MSEHKIGEQWIENGRMYKAISGKFNCLGCSLDNGSVMCIHKNIVECEEGQNFIIHDLGPVNEDGLLACPFCKEFPKGVSKGTEYKNDCEISIFYIEHSCKVIQTTEFTYSEQQSIDAWNWRA